MQDIAWRQRATAVAAKSAQYKGAFAAQILGDVEAAAKEQVSALTGAAQTADAQKLPGLHGENRPGLDCFSIQAGAHLRTGQTAQRRAMKTQACAADRHLDAGGAFVVAQQSIAQPE